MKTDKAIKWQELERMVRLIAQIKFSGTPRAEDIAGVKCDCIIHLKDGSVIIVEISKEQKIEKLRTDLAKFNTLRPYFFAKNIFPKCYFITVSDPTPSLVAAGEANHVNVYSVNQFINLMIGIEEYSTLRSRQAFGSAIDLYSGEPDEKEYVSVSYYSKSGEEYSVDRISSELIKGKVVILIGDYGSGKSRCVKEVFNNISLNFKQKYRYPIAINLKDNWGLKRSSEIINRHLTDIGLGDRISDFMRVSYTPACIYLLDGFDEIGAQTWSDDPTKLVEIRKHSLSGVKELIANAKGGVLVTGREHYFNNDMELISCLVPDQKEIIFLQCNQELSSKQFSQLIGRDTNDLPSWIPKKPLIGTIIRDIEPEIVENIFSTSTGQIDFWDLLLDAFCTREAKINPILDTSIIRSLYNKIGRLSRITQTSLGPISIKSINDAFESVTGRPPTDESAIILQRLPGLGRIGAESLDRKFVDTYILDGLKAEDVLDVFSNLDKDILNEEWKHPVESFGAFFISARLQSIKQTQGAVAYIKRNINAKNRVILSDIMSAAFIFDAGKYDFSGLAFSSGKFYNTSLADCQISGMIFEGCTFDYLDITDANPQNLTVLSSAIIHLNGVTSEKYLPTWIKNCAIEDFQSISTLSQIKDVGLTIAQTFLLSSLRKLFLQKGSGKKTSSMYKGYGDLATKRTCEKVISVMLKEKFCSIAQGTTEDLYIPDRSKYGRVMSVMNQLTQSKDPLWLSITRIN